MIDNSKIIKLYSPNNIKIPTRNIEEEEEI